MIRILIVEDDPRVRLLLKAKLSNLYQILEAADGEQALEVLDRVRPDLMIVDIQMPKMNGCDLVHSIRDSKNMIPVIMLTAMSSNAYKKEGFSSGADDYMTKPIEFEELIWRIEALLRRAKIATDNRIQIGQFSLDRYSFEAKYKEHTIVLTIKEFELLYKLLSYPGVVITKQQLMDDIWGYDSDTDYDTIKTYISRLRNKFAECKEFDLISIRGLGYKAVLHESREEHEK